MAEILFGDRVVDAELVVFDKDGTLIRFDALWAHYTTSAVEALMASLEQASGADGAPHQLRAGPLRADLYASLGYDPINSIFDPHSPVVTAPLTTINTLAAGVLYRHGWGWLDAELHVQRTFGPVMGAPLPLEMIHPTAPLSELFDSLRAAGVQIAVVTSDDRAPTVAALQWLEIFEQIAFIACADDGYPSKPAPQPLWAACEATGVAPERTVMVGDSTTDMLTAQRAGVALRVAVLTGTMNAASLAPLADVVLDSIAAIRVA